jgi:Glucodextranase, domain B
MTGTPRKPAVAGDARPRSLVGMLLIVTGSAFALGGLIVVAGRILRSGNGRLPPESSVAARASSAAGGSERSARMPEVDSRIFQVTEATGRVETRREGQWVLVVSGDVLTQDDLVRTGVGRAILRRGATQIELRDRVEIRLDSISQAGASVDLRRGRVVAHIGRSGGNVAITAARTRTSNEGDAPARFIVTADDRGRVAVATTEGSASFESEGRSVRVMAGNTTRAEPGQPPTDPEKISEDIFLSVTWPAGDRREDKVPVTGRTDPNSAVRVNGTTTEVDRGGHFVASVPVRVGANPIEIEVEDISGRIKRESREVRKIPTRPPRLAPVPTELWKR